MSFDILWTTTFDAAFFAALASIVLIDLILAGDNAVVIAMAVRSLPRQHRRRGILLGSAAAVLLRVVATFFVAQLLRAPCVKLIGGVLIGWIAVKLFVEGAPATRACSTRRRLSTTSSRSSHAANRPITRRQGESSACAFAAARVRAALFTDRRLQLPTLAVAVEGDGILVQGVVHRPEEKRRIQEAACAQAGPQPVRFDLRYR